MSDTPNLDRPRRRHLVVAGLLSSVLVVGTLFGVLRPAAADEGASISLKPGDRKVIVSTRPMGTTAVGENGPSKPSDCADEPDIALGCDVYKLHIDLDKSEGALNFLTLRLDFETPTTPSLSAVAVALRPINAGDLDIGVWDMTGAKPARVAVAGGGGAYDVPEIAAFEPLLSDYMITIESTRAPLLGYTFTLQFSNELFDEPFEALDPALADRSGGTNRPTDFSGQPVAAPPAAPAGSFDPGPSGSAFSDFNPPAPTSAALLAPAPVLGDSDFAGFRSVVDNSLAPAQLSAENAAAIVLPAAKDPGAPMLIFWLLVVPLILLAIFAAVMRRRRPTALQG